MEIPVNIASSFAQNDAIQTNIYSTEQVQHLFFNCRDGACTDKAVREAISYAIDLEALRQVATAGYGEISNGWFMPGGTYYVDVYDGAERNVDVEKAKQILADAGYEGGLTLTTIVTQKLAAIMTVIQENLRAIGIDLNINSLDTAQYVTEAQAGNYDIILTGSAIETRKPTLFTFYQKGNYKTVIGGSKVTTDELDEKITNMIQTSDVDEAKKLSEEIIRTIKDEHYALDLYTEYQAVVMNKKLAVLWTIGSGKQDNNGLVIQNYLADRLVIYDSAANEVKPCLATAWEWVDEKHIQFTLRDDVTMSDGTPLVAEDVIYTLKMASENCAANGVGRYIDPDTCKIVDDHTVIVGINTIAPDFLSMMSEAAFGIVSEGDVEAAGGPEAAVRNPVMGAGKYIFKEWQAGQYILLERNENYWNKDYNGYYKQIKFTFTNDAAAREMAVESGDAGIALEIPVNIAGSFEQSDAVQTEIYTASQVQHLFFNCRDGVCTDKAVREAISYALDLNALVQVGTAGYGQISNGWFVPGGTYYTDVYDGAERKVDIEKAKQILADAGYSDGLKLKTIVRQNVVAVMTVIQENLRAIGIDLQVDTLDTAQYVTESQAGNYDIIMVGSNVETRMPTLLKFFRKGDCEKVIGGCKVTTDEIDSIIIQAIETPDVDEAKGLISEILHTIKDEFYAVDLYTEYIAVIMNNDIAGFTHIERGYVDCTTLYKVQ